MNAQYYKTQNHHFRLVKNMLAALNANHPARLAIEPELLACDENSDIEALFSRLLKLIEAEGKARGYCQP